MGAKDGAIILNPFFKIDKVKNNHSKLAQICQIDLDPACRAPFFSSWRS